jgi:hypothetical protein
LPVSSSRRAIGFRQIITGAVIVTTSANYNTLSLLPLRNYIYNTPVTFMLGNGNILAFDLTQRRYGIHYVIPKPAAGMRRAGPAKLFYGHGWQSFALIVCPLSVSVIEQLRPCTACTVLIAGIRTSRIHARSALVNPFSGGLS